MCSPHATSCVFAASGTVLCRLPPWNALWCGFWFYHCLKLYLLSFKPFLFCWLFLLVSTPPLPDSTLSLFSPSFTKHSWNVYWVPTCLTLLKWQTALVHHGAPRCNTTTASAHQGDGLKQRPQYQSLFQPRDWIQISRIAGSLYWLSYQGSSTKHSWNVYRAPTHLTLPEWWHLFTTTFPGDSNSAMASTYQSSSLKTASSIPVTLSSPRPLFFGVCVW